MGWGFRKSIKLGPMRVSVGKRGIGVSAGVKGARIGINSRGAYVSGSIPGTGITYRENLGTRKKSRPAQPQPTLSDIAVVRGRFNPWMWAVAASFVVVFFNFLYGLGLVVVSTFAAAIWASLQSSRAPRTPQAALKRANQTAHAKSTAPASGQTALIAAQDAESRPFDEIRPRSQSTSSERVIDLHFTYQNEIQENYRRRNEDPKALDRAIQACQNQIALASLVVKAFEGQSFSTGSLPSHKGYEQLAIIREKQGDYPEAIRLSAEAKLLGWAGDWEGRIERLTKKQARQGGSALA